MINRLKQQNRTDFQLIIIAITIISNVVAAFPGTNIGWFAVGMNTVFVMAGIMLGFSKMDKKDILMKIINIVASDKTIEEKRQQLELMLKMICEQLGIYYEDELKKFRKYIGDLVETEPKPEVKPIAKIEE